MVFPPRTKAVALLLCALLLIGCVPQAAPAEAAPAAPMAEGTPTPTAAPTATAEPTATPLPDPLLQRWLLEEEGFSLTLYADGQYEAVLGERQARGAYLRQEGLLRFVSPAGHIDELPYCCDGTTLTLFLPQQAALSLSASADTAFLTAANEPAPEPEGLGDEPPAIAYAYANKGVVTVELAPGSAAQDYCLTCLSTPPEETSRNWLPVEGRVFSTFKYDGAYYLFVRDGQGRLSAPYPITVSSGYTYVIRSEGLTSLRLPLEEALAAAGTSVDSFNEAVAQDIAMAGFYSRMGAVTSAVSAVSRMAELGYSIPYQGQGKYQERDDWGFNPQWGSRLARPTEDGNGKYYYTGMQCVGSIVWALKQAGLDISNGATGWQIGRLGERTRTGDNKIKHYEAKPGDFVQVNKHYEMVLDRLDTDADGEADSFLFYEMMAPHLTFLILTYRNVQGREWFNMDAMYENEGRLNTRNRIWVGTSHIPVEDFPAYLQQAYARSHDLRALDRLLRGLGVMTAEEATILGGEA